jgi:hypothetical protein
MQECEISLLSDLSVEEIVKMVGKVRHTWILRPRGGCGGFRGLSHDGAAHSDLRWTLNHSSRNGQQLLTLIPGGHYETSPELAHE